VIEGGDVLEVVSPAIARQAIELCRALPIDPAAMLDELDWWQFPGEILSIGVNGEELRREGQRHAVMCARRTQLMWERCQRAWCLDVLLAVWRDETEAIEALWAASAWVGQRHGAVQSCLGASPAEFASMDARNLIDDSASTLESAWQQARLIKRVLTLLERT